MWRLRDRGHREVAGMNAILQRTAFKTSRLLDFFSERELTMQ